MPGVTVRMAVGGNAVERLDVAQVIHAIESRLHGDISKPLAVGWIDVDHPNDVVTTEQQWLLLAEGLPVAWRGQLLTTTVWPRVTSDELLPRVLALAEKGEYRVAFLVGTVGMQQRLTSRLVSNYPDLALAGMWSPNPHLSASKSASLVSEVCAARAQILIVGLESPQQERWIDRYGADTGARVLLSCGSAVDHLTRWRAPRWFRRGNLDLLFRLSREPRRLARRYLIHGPIEFRRAISAHFLVAEGVYYAAASGGETSIPPTSLPRSWTTAVTESTSA